MFITCHTYRQATYAPDQIFTGVSGTTSSSNATSQVGVNSFTTTNYEASIVSSSVQAGTFGVQGIIEGTAQTVGSTTYAKTTVSNSNYSSVEIVNAGTFTITYTNSTGATGTYTSAPVVFYGISSANSITSLTSQVGSTKWLLGNTAFTFVTSITAATSFSSINYTTRSTVSGSAVTVSISFTSSSTHSSSSITNSTTSNSTGLVLGTSINTTVTSTVTFNIPFAATTTVTVTRSIWTMHLGSAVTTSASASTITTTQGTTGTTVTTTATTTTATPSWWGWSSERGTVVIATGNFNSNDLPAILNLDSFTSNQAALWNFTTATMATIWPDQPSATQGMAGTINSSAVAHTSNVSMVTATTVTVFGTYSFTTTTTGTAVAPFADSIDTQYTTAANPLSTITLAVTSYGTTTATQTALVLHSLNTTTTTTSQTFNADIVTAIISNLTFVSTNGTFLTTVTLTTLVVGYTTASMATGKGITQIGQTTLITGPQISVTTTTMQVTWFYDTSCPTQIGTTTGSSASTTTTLANGNSVTSSSTFNSGISNGFTRNLFSAPFILWQHGSSLTTFASQTVQVYAPAAVQAWAPHPSMQGFSPWTQTNSTYQNISAPAGLPILAFLPFELGRIISYNSTGGAVTSTQWGVWAIFGYPVTTTFAVGTSTLTSVCARTYSASGTNASSTVAIMVSAPGNGDQAAASIYSTATYTTTTGSPTSTTKATSTTSYLGFSLGAAGNSKFLESYGYSGVSNITATVSGFQTATYSTGTAASATLTSVLITTVTLSSTVSYSTSWFAGNTDGNPTAIAIPGIGGFPRYTAGAATIYACGAAVSLFSASAGSTFTWSTGDPNFVQIVVGANFTATSSATSSLAGAGSYAAYTIPGEVSMLTSPAISISTGQNKFVPGETLASQFWNTPAPVLTPNGILNR